MSRLAQHSAFIAAMLAFAGCVAANDGEASRRFNPQQSQDAAKQSLDATIVPGMTIEAAVRRLRSDHFLCNEAGSPGTKPGKRSVLCMLSSSKPPVAPAERMVAPPTPVDWFVTLDSDDGSTLSRMQVQRRPGDLDDRIAE